MLRLDLGRRVASGLGSGIVPGLHTSTTEDDEETVAHQVNCGRNEEDHTPLFHIVLQGKVDRILISPVNQLIRNSTYLVGYNEADQEWRNDTHNVSHAVGNAHQSAGKVGRQINVIQLESEVAGAVETDRHGKQTDS